MIRPQLSVGPRAVALMIILFFLVDRAMSLGFLLPGFCVEDERWVQEGALKMVREATLNPGTHKYPHLIFFLTAGVYASAYLAANVKALPYFESWQSFSHHRAHYFFGFEPTIFLGRLLVAALGAIALWIFYLLARGVFDEYLALCALFFLSTSPAFLFSTQLLKNDVLVVIGVSLVLLAALRIVEQGRKRDYLLAGLALGFCLAAKYHWIAVAPLLFAHRFHYAEEKIWPAFKHGHWLLIFPACLFAFLLLSPGTWLDLPGALQQAGLELAIQNRLDPLLRRSPSHWWQAPVLFQFSSVLPLALGIPLYLLSLLGLFFKTDLRDPKKLVLWSYPLAFLAFMIAFSELGVPHLYTSAVPFFSLFAASVVSPWLATETRWKRGVAVAGLAGIVGYNFFLFHGFTNLEDWLIRESVQQMESTHRRGERDLGLVPYFANPDLSWHTQFAPQFLLSPKLLAETQPDRLLLHHTFFHAYLDNKELTSEPAVANLVLTFLSLRLGQAGYKESECWTAQLPTGAWYQTLWPDLAGLKTCIYVKTATDQTPPPK